MDEAHFADFTSRCQSILASQGSLHLAAVAPATRDLLPRLGLRVGWKEALQALALGGVPTYVFSRCAPAALFVCLFDCFSSMSICHPSSLLLLLLNSFD